MRTPKIEALYRLIDWLNVRFISASFHKLPNNKSKIIKLDLDSSPLGNSSWLSGFIEADGNFYCLFKINSKGLAVRLSHYMRITQKRHYTKNSNIL
jgi:hypothetical protein